jgi:hypothetical protein
MGLGLKVAPADALALLVPYAEPRRSIGADAERRPDFLARVVEIEQGRAVRT